MTTTTRVGMVILMGMISILSRAQAGGSEPVKPVAKSAQSAGETGSTNLIPSMQPSTEPSSKPAIGASEAVITIHGLCEKTVIPQTTSADTCKTVITKEEFEKLVDSMNVLEKPIAPETRRSMAEVYAQYLAFELPASKAGLEGTQRYQEIMRWWRLRTLAALYRGSMQEEFKNPSAEEIHTYYQAHLAAYRRMTIARVVVPRLPGMSDEAKRQDEKALDTARTARARVAKGDDVDAVQKDAFAALGLSSPPPTKLGATPGSSFPPEETDELFSLKAGEASKVETEGASYVIYKIVSNEMLPEEKVKDDVARAIAQSKYDDAIRVIDESAKPEFNEAYFGPPAAKSAAVRPASPHP